MRRGEYNTRQKRRISEFLEEHSLENFSVDDVVSQMHMQGDQIGRSTVYRYLEALSEMGNVRKYQNSQGLTQYQHFKDADSCTRHFHMLCKECGALLHVDCALMHSMSAHIAKEHGFTLDSRETVLLGICAMCGKEKNQGEREDGSDHVEKCHHCL